MSNIAGRHMLRIAGTAAFVGPVVLLGSDLIHVFIGMTFEWTIGLFIAMMLMTAATVGFTYLVSSRSGIVGLIGGCFAFFGLIAGASMQAFFRSLAVLQEHGSTGAVNQLQQTFKMVASTQMIGLAWPIGAFLLGIASFKAWPGQYILPLLFIVGAISFPIGRIAGSDIAVILSGLMFVGAYSIIGSRLFAAAGEE